MELVCEEVPNGFLATVSYTQQKTDTKTEVTEKLGEKLGERLGENMQKILDIVVDFPQITIVELSNKLTVSTTAIENNISKLKAKGLFERIGPDKGGYWKVL
ncbi:MAG: HTH domain-containing protein [Prevotellaceae bacterium]|jgi:ATP-dependent DNA helicase RecG|nr:HTH domain-containing protein [Prevotellaceae bacterium]